MSWPICERLAPTNLVLSSKFDLKKFGIWVQFKPKPILSGEQMITDEISFYIKGYDNYTAVEQMQKYPQMRRILAGDEERSDEEI